MSFRVLICLFVLAGCGAPQVDIPGDGGQDAPVDAQGDTLRVEVPFEDTSMGDTSGETHAGDSSEDTSDTEINDTGTPDAGFPDTILDTGVPDTGVPDTGVPDTGVPDTGAPDSGVPDAGRPDSGVTDTGTSDTGFLDTGTPDTGIPDTGFPDTGTPDTGRLDSGSPDTGRLDSGFPDTGTLDTGFPDTGFPDTGFPVDTGFPACPNPTHTRCNGECVNLQGHPNNCGACGVTCGAGTACCNGQCVGTTTVEHCGGCLPCGANFTCNGIRCVCNTGLGLTLCAANLCTNLMSDFNNCGRCGFPCNAAYRRCYNGRCIT